MKSRNLKGSVVLGISCAALSVGSVHARDLSGIQIVGTQSTLESYQATPVGSTLMQSGSSGSTLTLADPSGITAGQASQLKDTGSIMTNEAYYTPGYTIESPAVSGSRTIASTTEVYVREGTKAIEGTSGPASVTAANSGGAGGKVEGLANSCGAGMSFTRRIGTARHSADAVRGWCMPVRCAKSQMRLDPTTGSMSCGSGSAGSSVASSTPGTAGSPPVSGGSPSVVPATSGGGSTFVGAQFGGGGMPGVPCSAATAGTDAGMAACEQYAAGGMGAGGQALGATLDNPLGSMSGILGSSGLSGALGALGGAGPTISGGSFGGNVINPVGGGELTLSGSSLGGGSFSSGGSLSGNTVALGSGSGGMALSGSGTSGLQIDQGALNNVSGAGQYNANQQYGSTGGGQQYGGAGGSQYGGGMGGMFP